MTPARHAPFGTTVALAVACVIGTFFIATPVALLLIPATVLPPPFAAQHQHSETLLFLLAFVVLLPLSLVALPRVADRIAAGPNAPALAAVVGTLVTTLVGALLFVKASEHLPWGSGLVVLLLVMAAWCAVAAVLLWSAARSRPSLFLLRLASNRLAPAAGWIAMAVLAPLMALAFAKLGSIALAPLLVGCAFVVLVVAGSERWSVPRLPRPWGSAVDIAIVLLLLLAVPNVVIFVLGDPSRAIETTILQFHQDFFLGPANHVLGGGAMLVDTLSQYGVGSILFLAGLFEFIPIGNGTLGLIEGVLTALVFITAFLILRVTGISRLLAGAAMTLAVIVLVYGLQYPIGGLLQHGSIRFGLPIGLIAGAVLESRWPRRAGFARAFTLAIVAVSSIWALEAFAYTLITLAALVGFQAWTLWDGGRRRFLAIWAIQVAAACLVAHATFALTTLAATGQLPDWGHYITTLHAFLAGGIGDLTYDFVPWTPAIAVGVGYLASAVAIVLMLMRRLEIVERERPTLIALTGSTAYGIALYSYFVNRSADHILPYISLPAVLIGTLWLGLLLRPLTGASLPSRRAGLTLATGLAALLVAVAWSGVGFRFSQSAIAMAPPGGRSLPDALTRLWDGPALSPGAESGERLLEQYMPGQHESVVLTSADLGVEILLRTGRINEIPLSDPWEDSLVPSEHLAELKSAVDSLSAGERMLLDRPAARLFVGYLRQPNRDPLVHPLSLSTIVPSGIALLQGWVLKEIGERFTLNTVARGDRGMRVVELVAR
jgi:hypothetical protein